MGDSLTSFRRSRAPYESLPFKFSLKLSNNYWKIRKKGRNACKELTILTQNSMQLH